MKNTVKNTRKNWIIAILFSIAVIANNIIDDYKYVCKHQELNDDQMDMELAKRNMKRSIIHCIVAIVLHHVMDK